MVQSLMLAQAADGGFFTEIQAFFSFAGTHWQFCLLHFLEFAIWGAWFVVLGNLLNARGFSRKAIGRIYATMPIGSMISPLFMGVLADTLINTELLIGVLHLIGAVLLFGLARAKQPKLFYWLMFCYALAFSPTLSLVNSIVFAHDADIFAGMAEERFPWIRVFGTIGWIAAGMSHALFLRKDAPMNERPIYLACILSIVLGLFAFTLPATKPAAAENTTAEATTTEESNSDEGSSNSETASQDKPELESVGIIQGSLDMLRLNPVFFLVTFVAAMAMGLYFAFAALFLEKTGLPPNTVGPVMTLGQWIEIFFMLTLPWFLGPENKNMSWVLLVGLSAWAIRFAFFSIGKPMAIVLFGIAIHGICFDFFFAAGFINTNMIAPLELTATAQTLYGFLVYGLGMYLGSEGAGWLNQYFSSKKTDSAGKEETVTGWRGFWAVPCVIVTVATVIFLLSILEVF